MTQGGALVAGYNRLNSEPPSGLEKSGGSVAPGWQDQKHPLCHGLRLDGVDNQPTEVKPRLQLSERAADRIRAFRASQGHPQAWVSVAPGGLQGERLTFTFALVEPDALKPEELLVEGAPDVLFVAPRVISRHVVGSRVEADPISGALSLETGYNPDQDPLAQAVQQLLDTEINPAVAGHGGYIGLLDIADGVAYVQMGGGCQGCGLAEVTLSQGVRSAILERFPEIRDVVDTTDHASGTNPYYEPAKK